MSTLRELERRPVASRHDDDRAWQAWRVMNGRLSARPFVAPPGTNHKLAMAARPEYGLSLLPHRMAGVNLCPASTPACRAGCLESAGRGGAPGVRAGRELRARFLLADPTGAADAIAHDVRRAIARESVRPVVRLNVLSDVAWERIAPWLLDLDADYIDYTKRADRLGGEALPANYRLVRSATERDRVASIAATLAAGHSVAVVADYRRGEAKPDAWHGLPAVDGDASDLWMLGRDPVVGLLYPKGALRGAPIGWSQFVKPRGDR